MGSCARDEKTIVGLIIFVACLVVAIIFILVAAFNKVAAQPVTAPSPPYQRQHEALAEMMTAAGILPGLKYKAAGTNYVIKEITIIFTRGGNHSIEIKSEVAK
jgi:hypothetical protein